MLEGEAGVVLVHFHGERVLNVLHLGVTHTHVQYGQVLSYGP